MALHIFSGGAGSGKSHAVFTHIIEESRKAPGRRFFVLVPEQATMETQRQIVKLHPCRGIMNIEVLSLTRLAYRVFGEVGFRREALLEEIGKTFLLEKAALEQKKNLKWFGNLLTKPEFLQEIKAVISEFLLYDASLEKLHSLTENAELGGALQAKLGDLTLLLGEFRKKLQGSYMTAEELPERLSVLVKESALLKGSVLVLDGFTGFTPLQLKLVKELMAVSQDLYVTVTMDARQAAGASAGADELFSMSADMVRQLTAIAAETGTPLAETVYVSGEGTGRHASSPQLAFLERNLFREHSWETQRAGTGLRLLETASPREELAFAAREICRMIREEGYRYRDFAVVTGDLKTYGSLVREFFPEAGIPFFVDEKRSLKHNPFVEFLRAALETVSDSYSYQGLFRMLKCGVMDIDRRAVDYLENYVTAMGIRGRKRWQEPFLRSYRGEDPGELPYLNQLREKIAGLLEPLSEVFSRRGSTVKEKTTALYELCLRVGAEEKLRERSEKYLREGRPEMAREYAQIWPYIVSFLDKLVAVLGDEPISMRDYRELVEAGFAEGRVAVIPPGHDQVLIGDVERSRLHGIRVLFFVGVNEGLVPKAPGGGGILTESDRVQLLKSDLILKPVPRKQIFIDRFYLYLTLAKPSEKLILTYPLAGTGGEAMRPAYLVAAVRRLFPDLVPETAFPELTELVERESTGMSLLIPPLSGMDGKGLSGAYRELFSHYLHHPAYARRAEALLLAAGSMHTGDRISRAAAKALYGTVLRNSASRLELFCSCRFAHFLAYGLKLKERPEYAFTGPLRGSILHRALELFAGKAEETGKGWAGLAPEQEEREALVEECLLAAVREEGNDVLSSSARNRYQLSRMRRLLLQTVWAQARQLEAGSFAPWSAEAAFGVKEGGALTELVLSDGARMQLTGRIDRVDLAEDGGLSYFKIVDYKTGEVSFDLAEVCHGLQLQLFVYADAVMEKLRALGKHPVPAGLFYCRIKDPVVEYMEAESGEGTRERLLKEHKPSGVVLEDPEVLRLFDAALQAGQTSKVIPAALKNDGSLSSRSQVLKREEFAALNGHVAGIVKRSAEEILEGSAEIDPYELKGRTACDYCPYRSVCGFDRRIPGYSYRSLTASGKEELAKLFLPADTAGCQ